MSWAAYKLFHNPMCGLIFSCGCTWSFLGGWKNCNVHFAGLRSPRCPWCVSPRDTPSWTWTTGEACTVSVMLFSWILAVSAFCRSSDDHNYSILAERKDDETEMIQRTSCKHSNPNLSCCVPLKAPFKKKLVFVRLMVPLFAFVVHHSLVGLAFALGTGYPYYYFFTFPNTQLPSLPLPPYLNVSTAAP